LANYLLGILTGAIIVGLAGARWWSRRARRERVALERARAAERMAEVGAMTAGLAHEIKNPLSTIGMNAQLLDEAIGDLPIDEDERNRIQRRIGTLARETERLRGILTDFLEFAGELHLHRVPTDLNELVTELTDFFLPQAERAGIRVRAEPADRPLEARVDAPHLKQAVLNLMLNATQAMEGRNDGRARELILRTGEQRTAGAREHVIHVIDTGPGMSPEQRARIYEPYFTTKRGGSGLGLPTSRRIVEAHAGRLELVSEPGRGTDFAIVLPAEAGSSE
jgi:signal transduction histidine kinase